MDNMNIYAEFSGRRVIGTWDMENIAELMDLTKDLEEQGEHIDMTSLPVAPEFKEQVDEYSNYPIWACDIKGRCLVGNDAKDIENITDIVSN